MRFVYEWLYYIDCGRGARVSVTWAISAATCETLELCRSTAGLAIRDFPSTEYEQNDFNVKVNSYLVKFSELD